MTLARDREKVAESILAAHGWATDTAINAGRMIGPGRYISRRNDRFGVFDVVGACGDCGVLGVQVTSYQESGGGSVNDRKQKIVAALGDRLGPRFRAQVWAYTKGAGWVWIVYEYVDGEWCRLGSLTAAGEAQSMVEDAPGGNALMRSALHCERVE